MAKLIYSAIASLDGYVEDKHGGFASLAPDDEVHAFINVLERPIGTYLYGRRMYETMVYWESVRTASDQPAVPHGISRSIWRGADKIVYSRTLRAPSSGRTRIERDFDPAAIKAAQGFLSSDISDGRSALGGQAMATGLVDECHLFPFRSSSVAESAALPADVRVRLELLAERRFKSGDRSPALRNSSSRVVVVPPRGH